jgi:AAA+ ATPase superfamily predicted ATPase
MKRLNQREREIAIVASDLFLKGSPEWRIAEYAYLKGFTSEQFSNFLEKLELLPENVKLTIYNHYRDIQRQSCFDRQKGFGLQLKHWIGLHDEHFKQKT